MVRVVITKKQKELILLLSQDNVYLQFGDKCINPLLDNGFIEAIEFHQNGNTYALSQTGQEWLDFVSPMVDQPQPAAEVETVDVDTLPGRDYAEMLQDDDLPFSDLGAEDTQELPTVKVEAEMNLSQLVDAALDPENSEALEQLRAMSWTASLWEIAMERDELSRLAWNMWYEKNKFHPSNPRHWEETLKSDRAFEILEILRNAVRPMEMK